MNGKATSLALGLCLCALPGLIGASEEPHQWLERMSAAMSQMNYQGTFVYVRGEEVETVRITHVVDEKGARERLVSVSGSPREVVRDADGVRWIAGDEGVVLANSASNRTFFPELPLGNTVQASDFYQFLLEGQQRIAGHNARRLDIKPRDEFRYGYRLWLEPQSGLLLQWELTGTAGETLAKLMFTELKMGAEVNPGELRSKPRDENAVAPELAASVAQTFSSGRPARQAKKLPPGFHLASHREQLPSADRLFEHLVYSDGIAVVSVYIEPADENSTLKLGLSRLGTTHAYSHQAETEVITALGDVPAATVILIGESVGPAGH